MTLDRAWINELAGELAPAKPGQLARSRFAPKSAPQHRDFGAGKVGLIK